MSFFPIKPEQIDPAIGGLSRRAADLLASVNFGQAQTAKPWFAEQAQQGPAKGDTGQAPQTPEAQQAAAGASWLQYANENAVRNQELSPELVKVLSFLPEMGLELEVFSGGQPEIGTSDARVGSVRHDRGNAADVFLRRDGQRLDWANQEHLPVFEEVVRRAKAGGVTGIGAGFGYMQPGSMHIGFGNEAVWGTQGKRENAAEWLVNSFYG